MRRIIDEKGRIFGRISVIDILVVLIVIALGAAVYVRFFRAQTTSVAKGTDCFTYTMKITGVRSVAADALREGDKLYDVANGTYLGQISSIRVEDSVQEYATLDGELKGFAIENRIDIYLDVYAEGMIADGRFYASRTYEISANGSVTFSTKYYSATGMVWAVPEKA